MILRSRIATVVMMTGVHRCTLLHRRSKRGVRHSRISFPIIITNLVSVRIMMQINTVTGGDTGHRHSVTFLFVLVLVNLSDWSVRSGAMKWRRQHRRWSIKMRESVRVRKSSCYRSRRIALMRRLTLANDLNISIELRRRRRNHRFPVVMILMVSSVVLVLRLSFDVEHLRRFGRLDFNSNLAVGVARARISRRTLRGWIPVTYATLLHLLKDVHGDATTRVRPRIRPRRISVESSANNEPRMYCDDRRLQRASYVRKQRTKGVENLESNEQQEHRVVENFRYYELRSNAVQILS